MKSTDLLFDIETDGFLENVTTLHSLVIAYPELDNNTVYSCCDADYTPDPSRFPGLDIHRLSLEEGLRMLMEADNVIGHNILAYDLPVLRKLYPWFKLGDHRAIDTLIQAKLRWPRDKLRPGDFAKGPKWGMPAKLYGNHSLEAFGYRLGVMKGEYKDECAKLGIDAADIWKVWRPQMTDYCVQDIVVTKALKNHIGKFHYAPMAERVEYVIQATMARVTVAGFPFRVEQAVELYKLICQERDELRVKLLDLFPPWYAPDGKQDYERDAQGEKVLDDKGKPRKIKVPSKVVVKRTRVEGGEKIKVKELNPETGKMRTVTKTVGGITYPEGAVYTKIKLTEFNPNSRDHIARCLMKRGWVPIDYTDDGSPEVDETILSEVAGLYPQAKPLSRYLLLQKRAGQLSEGKQGWLAIQKNGIIHAGYNTLGAVTRRATHSDPNIAQVPRVGSYFGAECRDLFWCGTLEDPRVECVLLGADLAGIELRMLAHYMAKYDGGAYMDAVVNGNSSDGTDVHSVNCRALGFDPKEVYVVNGRSVKGRDIAKTFIYAFLYGAGAEKLGLILGVSKQKAQKIKEKFLQGLPALAKLIDAVKDRAATAKSLNALDGGALYVRSAHSALNTLLQSAGAIVAKFWIDEAIKAYDAKGWVWGRDYIIRAWVHDELQVTVRKDIHEELGYVTIKAIESAGQALSLRCPVTGEFKVGQSWKDCH